MFLKRGIEIRTLAAKNATEDKVRCRQVGCIFCINTKLKRKDKTSLLRFTPFLKISFNLMLAAALLMSTSGHHHEIKADTCYTCQPNAKLAQERETPARQCALFCFEILYQINRAKQMGAHLGRCIC
jgi:hypothetical protein